MSVLAQEDILRLEKMIYLPMVLMVLSLDRQAMEKGPFKLKRPYMELIDKAMKAVHADLKETKIDLYRCHMKVLRGRRDDTFTEYIFYHNGREEHRRYLNLRLRNRVEELISIYFAETEKRD